MPISPESHRGYWLKRKLRFYLLISTLILSVSIYAYGQPKLPLKNDVTVFVIREVDFNINGRTRPFILISYGDFKKGRQIAGKENFQKYLDYKRQLLVNQRVLDEVRIEYFLGDSEIDGAVPVKLLVHVRDSWSRVIIPSPRYSTNDGFSLNILVRDFNFLGTMSPLRIDLGYRQRAAEREFSFMFESNTPFQAAGLNWNFSFDHFFSNIINEPLFYQNLTGISIELPWLASYFTFGINQFFTVNEENSEVNQELFGLGERHLASFASTEFFVFWELPLGIEVGSFGQLRYKAGISERINYPFRNINEARVPLTSFNHSLGFGRIDWIHNHRRGFAASLKNAFDWYIGRTDAPLRASLNGSAEIHWPLTQFFGISSRISYRQWWQWSERTESWIPYFNAGDLLRGVLDSDIRATRILSLNLDFPVQSFRFKPSQWFNDPRLRIVDFEVHTSPFTDMALFQGSFNKLNDRDNPFLGENRFSFRDMINTAGLEFIVFPSFFRMLQMRISIAYNLNRITSEGFTQNRRFLGGWDEIFLGLYHFY